MKVITIPVTPFAQNARILICEETGACALVDPGGDKEKILQTLEQYHLVPEKIILTHAHLDHVGAAKELKESFGVDIVGPQQDDSFWFDALPMQAQMFGFAPIAPFYPDSWQQHGDIITVGKLKLEIRHCPGHTPGHIVLVDHASHQVVVGDVIFRGSIGRTDFPRGDHAELIASINREILSLPDEYVLLPGHGDNTTVGHEKQHNPFISSKFG